MSTLAYNISFFTDTGALAPIFYVCRGDLFLRETWSWGSEGPFVGNWVPSSPPMEEMAKLKMRSQVFESSIPCSFWHITLPSCQVKREARWFDKWFLLLSNLPPLSAQKDSSYLPFLGGLDGMGREGGRCRKKHILLPDSFCGRDDQ